MFKSDIRGDFKILDANLNAKIDALRHQLETKMESMKVDVIRWVLTLNIAVAGIVIAAIKLL